MLKALLLFTLLCTCGPAFSQSGKYDQGLWGESSFNLGAVQLAIDIGYSSGVFNRQPELINFTSAPGQRDILKPINSGTIGFAADYAPATTKFSCGFKLSYSRRGYGHLVKTETGDDLGRGILVPSHVDYLDLITRFTYRPGRLLSASLGPYLSWGRKFEDNPFVVERLRTTFTNDYGIHLEGRVHFNRFHIYTAYLRSFRDYNFSSIQDFNINNQIPNVDRESPVSALQVGIGFTIVR